MRSPRPRHVRRPRLRLAIGALLAGMLAVAIAGCAPADSGRVLRDVHDAVLATSDPPAKVTVDTGKDGFASRLDVILFLSEDSMDSDRLKSILRAVVGVDGVDGFTQIEVTAFHPDFDGDIVDLRAPARELGFDPLDSSITGSAADIRKRVG